MTPLDVIDLAKVDPCPGCGVPVRRFASVPIKGNGLDAQPSGPWHCDVCVGARTIAICRSLEPPSVAYTLRLNLLALLAPAMT